MIIARLENIEVIKPLYKEYLVYMGQFFVTDNFDAWCEGALKFLELYSIEDDRYIYTLKESDSIIGFAFINKHFRFISDGFAIAEFYIRKDYERKGYGRRLAEHVFSLFPGGWEVAVTEKNISARAFWKQVVSSYTDDKYVEKKKSSFNGSGFLFNNTFRFGPDSG